MESCSAEMQMILWMFRVLVAIDYVFPPLSLQVCYSALNLSASLNFYVIFFILSCSVEVVFSKIVKYRSVRELNVCELCLFFAPFCLCFP